MNLNLMIDALLESLYIQKEEHGTVYSILRSKNIEIENMDIIWDKVNSLNLFGKRPVSNSDTYRDMMITRNAEGYEFVKEYKTYSNFIAIQKKQKEEEKIQLNKGINGSYWGGIGAFLAVPISIISLVYSCNQKSKDDIKNKLFKDSINIELRKVIQTNEKILRIYSKKDSLNIIKKK